MRKNKKPAICHPKKFEHAKGLCNYCYYKTLIAKNPTIHEKYLENKRRWVRNNKEKYYSRMRRYFLKRTYGITPEYYDQLLKKQNGVCAICFEINKNQRLAVDHCHKTKKIRGLLCSSCNYTIMGKIDKNPAIVQRLLDYIAEHPELDDRYRKVK